MRLHEIINESMDFYAGGIDKETNIWHGYVNDVSQWIDDDDDPWGDGPMEDNPEYDPDLHITLANANMRRVFDALGYDAEDMIPIDEFINVSTQWLRKHIGKQSPEEKPTVDKQQGGPTMISGGQPAGYLNKIIKKMNHIARIGKEQGATHVWAA